MRSLRLREFGVTTEESRIPGRSDPRDVGRRTMLQPRKHADKATCTFPRDHRLRKALSSNSLCEFEEIDKAEVSVKMMQSLERIMRAYPTFWSESSVQRLLVEIADTQYAGTERSAAEERLHTVIMRMVVPMTKIVEAEQRALNVERAKLHEAALALQRVQDECQHALADLMTQEHDRTFQLHFFKTPGIDTLLNNLDLDEVDQAFEEKGIATDEAERNQLSEKEKRIEQRELLVRLVRGGPTEFLKWARDGIQSHGLLDLDKELEHAWWPITRHEHHDDDDIKTLHPMPAPETRNSALPATELVYADSEKPALSNSAFSTTTTLTTLLCVVVTETLQQFVESCGRVNSPFSLPSAVIGFWMGLAGRMTYLAVATLFPQLSDKSGSSSGSG